MENGEDVSRGSQGFRQEGIVKRRCGLPKHGHLEMPGVHERLRDWGYHVEPESLMPLAGDGSDRRFFRLFSDNGRYVVLVSPRRKDPVDENDAVWHMGRHLHRVGVPVPPLLHGDPREGVFVFRDLGSLHLFNVAKRIGSRDRLKSLYHRAVILLAHYHLRAWKGFSPLWCHDGSRYDPNFVYERELLYFRRAFLSGFLGLDEIPLEVEDEFRTLAQQAGENRGVVVFHRDFQSRNLMVCKGSLWVIDFQGTRFGPPEYDLAALLLDPYVMLPSSLIEELVPFYWRLARPVLGGSYDRFCERFATLALCRCVQFLAAFAFLGGTQGKPGFLNHIPGGWQRLQELLYGPLGTLYRGLRDYVNRLAADAEVRRLIQTAGEKGLESP